MAGKERRKGGCKRACKGMLTFIFGMIMGVVLFIGAIAGTIYAGLTLLTVGKIEEITNTQILPDEAKDFKERTLLDIILEAVQIAMNISNIPLRDIIDKYSLPLPGEIMGINISLLYQYPVTEDFAHIGEVIDTITLNTVGGIAGIDFSTYNLPILTENLNSPIMSVVDTLMSSINGRTTLRSIERNFGISMAGDNMLLNSFKDVELSAFGNTLNHLTLSLAAEIDCDLFLPLGQNTLYVKSDRFEQVNEGDPINPHAEKYLSGADENGLIYQEARYIRKEKENGGYEYVAVNSGASGGVLYRHILYEPYNPAVHSNASELYAKVYKNGFYKSGENFYLFDGGYIKVCEGGDMLINLSSDGSSPLPCGEFINLFPETDYYFHSGGSFSLMAPFGESAAPDYVRGENSFLEEGMTGYLRVVEGSSPMPMQRMANIKIKDLGEVFDKIKSMRLCDLIDIYDEDVLGEDGVTIIHEKSPKILISLKNAKVLELSDSLNTLTLGDMIDIYEEPVFADDGVTVIRDKSPSILIALKNSKLSTLSSDINDISLGQVIDINEGSHALLRRLKDTKIGNLAQGITDTINTITFGELVSITPYDAVKDYEPSDDPAKARVLLQTGNSVYFEDPSGEYYGPSTYMGDEFIKPMDSGYQPGTHKAYSKKFVFVLSNDGNYYFQGGQFRRLDLNFASMPSGTPIYKKVYVSKIAKESPFGSYVLTADGYIEIGDLYKKTAGGYELDPSGTYIKYLGKSGDEVYFDITGKTRYNFVAGYLAASSETDSNTLSLTYNTHLTSWSDVTLTLEKSENILTALSGASLSTLNNTFRNLRLQDVFDPSPDTFFDGAIMQTPVSNLGEAITTKISRASIGDILVWGRIIMDQMVVDALQDVTISDFFGNLKIDIIGGTPVIVFDPSDLA